jgi:hypothetical protein
MVRTPLDLALWIFVAVRLLMMPPPGDPLRWWALLLALVAVRQVAVCTPERRWLRQRAPLALGLLGALIGVIAIGQLIAGGPYAYATCANPNFAGVGLAMLIPFALSARIRWTWRGLILLLIVAGLFAVRSRGGALAAAAAVALWMTWRRPRLRWLALAALPAVVLAGGLWLGQSDTVKVRLHWYEAAFKLGSERPLLGQGAGGFQREYPPIRPLEEYAISGGRTVHAVHNDYLESFAEGGLIGLAAHLGLLVAAAFALRRQRAAAASLLAFATASLVDLPLRDPSLLALAMLGLSFAPRRARISKGVRPVLVVAAIGVAGLSAPSLMYWFADRDFGHYLENRDPSVLDRVIADCPNHPGARLERASPQDLAVLIERFPHHADARYQATRDLDRDEAVRVLEEILLEHDPHHTLTRVRLAQLVYQDEPMRAVSLLEGAIAADPRPWNAYVALAAIQGAQGDWEAADRSLARFEARGIRPLPRQVIEARLAIELDRVELTGRTTEGFDRAAARIPLDQLEALARSRLRLAAERRAKLPPPKISRLVGESALEYARRIEEEKAQWRREVLEPETRPAFLVALHLSRVLVRRAPTAAHFGMLAEAARGLGDRTEADHAQGVAYFLECLEALAAGSEAKAETKLRRALRAYPGWRSDENLPDAIRVFLKPRPGLREAARKLFEPYPRLAAAVE